MAAERMSNELLVHGADDWVDLTELVWLAREYWPEADPVEAVPQVLGSLAADGLIEIGELGDGGFCAWDLSPTEAVARVRREWAGWNRKVRMGDVCWVANTPAGDQRAQEFVATGESLSYNYGTADADED